MSKGKSLIGCRYGRLVVKEKTQMKNKYNAGLWLCECDCGNQAYVTTSALNSGRKLSCGCINSERALRPGIRFGNLEIAEMTNKRDKTGKALWLCKCDCGGEKEVSAYNLRRGRTTHCGCKSKPEDLMGRKFGKLTALEFTDEKNKNGKRLWRCKCECGNEKLVLAASLKNGSVKSCGCMWHTSKIVIGGKYGKLTVLRRVANKKEKPMYLCRCECGNEKEYPSMWLLQGRVTSCGCSQRSEPVDLTNKRFGHVVALCPTEKRDGNAIMWECVCDCGNITYRSHGSLKKSGKNTNCGCLQSDISKENMRKAIHRVDDTVIEKLESQRPTSRNTSGVRGVYYNTRTKQWRAVIGFKKKQIYLGEYDTVEEAANIRKEAEEIIYKPFLKAYYDSKDTQSPIDFDESVLDDLRNYVMSKKQRSGL